MSAIKMMEEPGHVGALLIGLAGSVAMGASAGIDSGVFAVLRGAALLPAMVLVVTLLVVPALYVSASMMGVAIRLPELSAAVALGLRSSGVAALGLVGPVLFLLASSSSSQVTWLLVAVVLLVTALLGLRSIYVQLFAHRDAPGLLPLYLSWSLLVLGIGAKLVLQNLLL